MNVHLATAFYRKHLLRTHIERLRGAGVHFYPVCEYRDVYDFCDNREPWIHPILCEPLKSHEHAVRKLNNFLNAVKIVDDDYYCFMGDDDGHEPGFFDMIRQQTAGVVFVSLSRGNAIPAGAHPHPTYPLIIRGPADVRVYNIGLCQYVMKGYVARQMRFRNQNNYDDGVFADELKNKFPNDLCFLPNLFAFGNYYEPGRYTNDAWKIKPNWELPVVQ